MKKFTTILFIFFLGVVAAIFGYGFLFNKNVDSAPNKIVTTQQNKTTEKVSTKTNNTVVVLNVAEVAKHATKDDCYLIINQKVYDVSSFIDGHPGGVKKITFNCGGEVSGIFAAIHSNFAWDLLKKYYIGDLK